MLRFFYSRYLRYHISLVTEISEAKHATRTVNRSVVHTKLSTSAIMSGNLDIAKCFEFAKELTLEAGKILICHTEGDKIVQAKDANWDIVTNYDHKIEEVLIDGISKEYPDHRIIAEEAVAEKQEMPELTDAPTWFLDPIDGTHNFIHSFPQSCISVGLAVCKELVLGVIYNPSNSELYSAVKGGGAFLNGKPICTSKITELKKALQVIEPTIIIRYEKNRDIHLARMDALIEATQCTRSIGSAALTMAYIARGVVDCLHVDGLKVWDIAAGTVIVREAGGTVLDSKGGTYDIMKPNTVAASNETLAREMSKLIVDTDLKTQRRRFKRT